MKKMITLNQVYYNDAGVEEGNKQIIINSDTIQQMEDFNATTREVTIIKFTNNETITVVETKEEVKSLVND